MEIRIRQDCVEVEGYVNAVERKSNPLRSRMGRFVERIRKGAFSSALSRNDNVRILLNHDVSRDLGGLKDGNLMLEEDAIGLRAMATITDPEVIQKARDGKLVGWSFGFFDRDVECKVDEDGLPLRYVRDLDLEEVSILDDTKTPAYDGTLVSVRSDESSVFFGDVHIEEIQLRDETAENEEVPEQPERVEEKIITYDELEKLIADMKN